MSTDSIIPNFQAPNPKINEGPVYLITLNDSIFFLAKKLDEAPNTVHAIGFYVSLYGKNERKVISEHKDIIAATKPEEYVDVRFPWHRVESIQNLAYRNKGAPTK